MGVKTALTREAGASPVVDFRVVSETNVVEIAVHPTIGNKPPRSKCDAGFFAILESHNLWPLSIASTQDGISEVELTHLDLVRFSLSAFKATTLLQRANDQAKRMQ